MIPLCIWQDEVSFLSNRFSCSTVGFNFNSILDICKLFDAVSTDRDGIRKMLHLQYDSSVGAVQAEVT